MSSTYNKKGRSKMNSVKSDVRNFFSEYWWFVVLAIGGALASFYVVSINQSNSEADDQAKSLARPCLTISKNEANTFKPDDVENADFCSLDGERIVSVQTSNRDMWDFSQPWNETNKVSPLNNRLSFARKTPVPGKTEMRIETSSGTYFVVIAAGGSKEQ